MNSIWKRGLSLFVALMMIVSIIPFNALAEEVTPENTNTENTETQTPTETETPAGEVETPAGEGEGELEPIADEASTVTEIATVDDLLAFAAAVNAGDNFAGKTVKLTADIDLANIQWQPIGGDSVYFAGEFDGNGKTISNLTNTENVARKGLFGLVEKCYIHDLTLANVKFSGNTTGARVGALAGNLQYYNVIENVTINGLDYDLNDTDGLIGGLAAYSWTSYVKNCKVLNADMNISSTGDSSVGVMIAYGRGVGDARSNFPYADKIAEADYQGESVWNYCNSKVEGAVINLSGTVTFGGFLGADTYNSWRNYAHNNTVGGLSVTCAEGDGVYTVGGFMGSQSGGIDPAALSNNSVTGTITSFGTNTASTFGGFIGYKGGRPGGVTGSTANVTITAAAGDVGGFCGETQQYFAHAYEFNGCTAEGNVTTDNGTAGGFIANVQHGGDGSALNVTITNSSVSGTVNGTTANAIIGNINDNKNGAATGGEVLPYDNTVTETVKVNGKAVSEETLYGGKTDLIEEPGWEITGVINTVDELKEFAVAVNDGNTFAGKKVVLGADLDLSGNDGFIIGAYGKPFSGEFDGNGKTISNLTDSTAADHKGLFAHLNNAYVHDLTFKNVKFSGTCEGALYAGALVAEAESMNVIKNVDVNGITWDITSKNGSIGSIAGYSYDTVYVGCDVQGAEFKVTSTSSVNMGGMVGQGRGVGTFTTAYGNTETTSYVNCTVADVTFNVTGKTTVGGFLGCDGYNHWANYGTDCTVTGLTVNCAADDAQYTVGGFMGSNSGANYGKDYAFVNCSTTGVINAEGNTNTASTFGGFVGYVGGRPTALGNCTANVTINVSAGDVGGFCGETQQYFAHAYEFNGCAATGSVSTNNGNAGGFIANVQHGGDGQALNTTITGCTASGSVDATNGVAGGIIANVNDVKKDNPTGGDVTVSDNTNNTNIEKDVASDEHNLTHAPYAATIGEQGYESLADAIAAAYDGALIELADGTHTMPDTVANKNITIQGGKGAVVDMTIANGYRNASGSTIAFVGITAEFGNTTYNGLAHSTKITYTDCVLNGQQTLYATDVVFTNCTFNAEGDNYSIWTWGANYVAFNNCTFNSDGKSVLVYGYGPTDVTLTNCDFHATTNRGKAAVELGDDYGANYSVKINDCTADENFVPNMSTSNLWGNKNLMDSDGLSLVVDGTAVTLPAAFINRKGYSSLAEAIAVVQDGETIVLAAGTHKWDAGWKIQNKEVTFTKANADDAVLIDMVNIATGQNTSGATLNFKGLSMGFGTENYRGFQHTAKVTYTDCILNGKQFLYAPTVEFTNCTINNYADYSVWTYGASDVNFTGCTFNSGGKAVLVYNEDTTGSFVADIALNNCTFTDNDTLDTNKGAVELGNNPNKTNVYHIAFTGCTVNGFAVNDEGTSTGSTFWGNKNSMDSGNGSSVTIDGGENLMPESKILVINNLDELKAFRDSVNGGKTYEGMTVLLAADIDLGNELWTPIGTHTNIFSGTFDGQSHTISNLYISAETSRQGLFGCAGGVTIKNLTIHNAYVDSTNGSSIAVLIGHGDHNGVETKGHVLENIKITGLVQIKGVSGMGTVIGTAPNVNFTASNITVDVENGSYVDSTRNIMEGYPAGRYYSYTGGVFGQVWGSKFENITSNIDVIGACVGTGGITGGATGTWTNITHTGDVIIAGEKDMGHWYANKDENGNAYGLIYWWQGAGLISGYHGGTTFENCVSTGTLTYQADNTNTNEIYYNATLINPETRETIDTVTLCDSRFGSSRWNSDNTITVIDYAELGEDNQPVLPIVAKVGEAGYTTLQEAIEAAIPSNGTVILVTDVVEKGIKVPAKAVITIDLAGHTLYGDILSEGDLTIKDGTVKGTRFVSAIESCGEAAKLTTVNLEVISYRHALRIEGGEAIINGGTYTTLGKVDGDSDVHAVNAGGAYATTVTIKDGTFVGPKGSANTNSADSGSAVQAQANATVIIENGKFSGGQNHTLNATNGGSISVTGGEFDQDPAAYAAEGYKSEASATTEGWFTVVEDKSVAHIGTTGYESLADAIAAAKDGDIITLKDGTHTMPSSVVNKNITIKGGKDAVVDMTIANGYRNASGSTIAFEGITAEFGNTTYNGLAHSTKITYTDCVINGQQTLYATDVEFTNCTFNAEGNNYSIWTWGAKNVTFTDCTFNSDGKSVLVYGYGPTDVTLTNCEFHATSNRSKAAVELGDDYGATYNVKINNCTADANFIANNTASNLWGNKNNMTTASGSSVTIDGSENLLPSPIVYVAQIGETKYETLDEALINAKSGDVVEVIADIDNAGTLMIRPGVTLNIGAHTVKADYVVGLKGSMITGIPQSKDSTVPYAKLIVAQDSVVMPEGCYNNGTYDVLPVYNPAGYYEFSYFRVRVISDGVELTEESLYFQFVVDASGVAKADLLANGASDNGISIVVRLTWTTATGTAYQDFVFADEHIEAVFAPNSTANFYIRITGYQALGITGENLVVSGVVISETGAESAS